MIRLHLDSDVNGHILSSLRAEYRGELDVVAAWEIPGNDHISDEAQLSYAALEGRVLYTNDADFKGLCSQWYLAGRHHAGVIHCHSVQEPNLSFQLARLRTLLRPETPQSMMDLFAQLEDYPPSAR